MAAAVIVPAIILGVIAAGALNREEAWMEKRLEDTLRAEADQVVDSLQNEVREITAELERNLKLDRGLPERAAFQDWQAASDLVSIPFLISADKSLLWPRPEETASTEESAFLADNRAFLNDEVPILVFQDVATLPPGGGQPSEAETERERISREESTGDRIANILQARFRSSQSVQKDLYRRAQEQDMKMLKRKVAPVKGGSGGEEEETSIVVAERLPLSMITARGESGIIPRLDDSRLELFFWKKLQPGGETAGCLIDLAAFTKRLLARLPVPYSETRLLTVLDHNGSPILDPDPGRRPNWKRPFFAQEIGAVLPHWEVASYLTDPAALASRARSRTLVMGMVIAALLVTILVGGFVVFRSVTREIAVAQEKTTFAANVSHELKTPITSIRLFSEMIREGRVRSPEKQRQYLDLMVAESKRLSHLINNVLDFTRIERGEKIYNLEDVDVAETTRRVMEGMTVHLENSGFRVTFLASAEVLRVRADSEALEQVLINLLSNAEKYSKEKKEIEVAVEREGRNAVIAVRDRGIGVPPARAKKIFEKFYRVDSRLTSRNRGTGLGLSIARSIARDHGGDVAYSPREGGGSQFQIRLPLAA